MFKKIVTWTVASILLLGVGGYCGFWWTQSKKLEIGVVEMIKSINENFKLNGTHVKYEKIEKSGFPYNLSLKIKNLSMETTKKITNPTDKSKLPDENNLEPTMQNPDVINMDNTDIPKDKIVSDENLKNNDQIETVTKITIEEKEISSDLMLKKFTITNTGNIKLEDEKNEVTNVDFKPRFMIEFFESPFEKISSNMNDKLKNIKEIDFKNKGYKVYDHIGKTLQESSAKNVINIIHKIENEKDNLYVKINLDNKTKLNNLSDDKPKTPQTLAIEKALYSTLNLEVKMFDLNNREKNNKFTIDLKNLDWDMSDAKLHANGSFYFKKGDYVPYGLINVIVNNNKELFNTVCGTSNDPSGNTDCNFLKKILPEIANETSGEDNGDIKVIYHREEDKATMIGKKNLEEFLSEYYNFMKKL
jgi:hypothetical protein